MIGWSRCEEPLFLGARGEERPLLGNSLTRQLRDKEVTGHLQSELWSSGSSYPLWSKLQRPFWGSQFPLCICVAFSFLAQGVHRLPGAQAAAPPTAHREPLGSWAESASHTLPTARSLQPGPWDLQILPRWRLAWESPRAIHCPPLATFPLPHCSCYQHPPRCCAAAQESTAAAQALAAARAGRQVSWGGGGGRSQSLAPHATPVP